MPLYDAYFLAGWFCNMHLLWKMQLARITGNLWHLIILKS